MNYEGQICRTPRERASFMLPISVGCPYNRCTFCMLFKHLDYRVLPYEQVQTEIMRAHSFGKTPDHVMLGDGNAFGVPAKHLLRILESIHKNLPDTKSISADSTISAIAAKSDSELKALSAAGLKTLYIGIESGLDSVLKLVQKDHLCAQAKKQIARLHAAGIDYAAHIMVGVAGHGKGLQNAEATAHLLNDTRPIYICNFTLGISPRSPLVQQIARGEFSPAAPTEELQEERSLIQQITIPVDYDGFNDAIKFRCWGSLPQDKDKLCARIDEKLKSITPLAASYQ